MLAFMPHKTEKNFSVEKMKLMDWPARSPDLNPIEKCGPLLSEQFSMMVEGRSPTQTVTPYGHQLKKPGRQLTKRFGRTWWIR